MRQIAIGMLALAALTGAEAQTNSAAQAARTWRQAHESPILGDFCSLLAIPNIARDNDAIRKNAAAVSALLEKRGVKTRYLEVPGAPPVVFGEMMPGRRGHSHHHLLRALRRAAARSQGVGDASVGAGD